MVGGTLPGHVALVGLGPDHEADGLECVVEDVLVKLDRDLEARKRIIEVGRLVQRDDMLAAVVDY